MILTSWLPAIFVVFGLLILIGTAVSLFKVDQRWISRVLHCPRCRHSWSGYEKFCERCRSRGSIYCIPRHQYPATYWLPREMLGYWENNKYVPGNNERDAHGFDEISTVVMRAVPKSLFVTGTSLSEGSSNRSVIR